MWPFDKQITLLLKRFNGLVERVNRIDQFDREAAASAIYASKIQIDATFSQLSSQNFRITEIEKWILEQSKPIAKPKTKRTRKQGK